MFIEHIESNVQSVMTQTPRNPKSWVGGLYYGGEIIDGEQNRHFFTLSHLSNHIELVCELL